MPNYTLKINGETKSFSADEDTPLLWVLRDELGIWSVPNLDAELHNVAPVQYM